MLKTLALTLMLGGGLGATTVPYVVTVNTTDIAGQTGFLDFQFNPGGASVDPASVTITSFATDGVLGAAEPSIGDVTGTLPTTVLINNTAALNDYAHGITFGNSISFTVTFNFPTPSGTATAGSAFGFSMYNSDFTQPLLTSDPDGFYFVGGVDTAGRTFLNQVPEPTTLLALPLGLAALVAIRRKRTVRA